MCDLILANLVSWLLEKGNFYHCHWCAYLIILDKKKRVVNYSFYFSAISSLNGTVSLEDLNVEFCDVVKNLSTVLTKQSDDAILPEKRKC